MVKYKDISIDIYKVHIEVFVGDFEEFVKAFKENCRNPDRYKDYIEDMEKGVNERSQFEAMIYWNGDNRMPVIIYIPSLSMKPSNISNIVHELSHAAFCVLGKVDITVDMYNNEAYAYLIGYLAQETFDKKGYIDLVNAVDKSS